jgi:hypothetical protein
MRQDLADSPTALQTLGVATIDHLRNAANIADNGSGNISQAGFNRALQNMAPKSSDLTTMLRFQGSRWRDRDHWGAPR